MEKDKRINGEYDPKYSFNSKPTEDEKKAAREIIEKYEKIGSKTNK